MTKRGHRRVARSRGARVQARVTPRQLERQPASNSVPPPAHLPPQSERGQREKEWVAASEPPRQSNYAGYLNFGAEVGGGEGPCFRPFPGSGWVSPCDLGVNFTNNSCYCCQVGGEYPVSAEMIELISIVFVNPYLPTYTVADHFLFDMASNTRTGF